MYRREQESPDSYASAALCPGVWSNGVCDSSQAIFYGDAHVFSAGLAKESADLCRRSFDLAPRSPYFEPKAKAVIQLFMNGGPISKQQDSPSGGHRPAR